MHWYNENDGEASFAVQVNGVTVDSWTGIGGSAAADRETRRISVELKEGDEVTLVGQKNAGEPARIDSLAVSVNDGSELPAEQIERIVRDYLLREPEIVYEALPTDDPQVRQPEITRAKQLLGWEPEIGWEDGLRETVEWYQGSFDSLNPFILRGIPAAGHNPFLVDGRLLTFESLMVASADEAGFAFPWEGEGGEDQPEPWAEGAAPEARGWSSSRAGTRTW